MKFGVHYFPTYVPDLDGSPAEFYRRMFEQLEEECVMPVFVQG